MKSAMSNGKGFGLAVSAIGLALWSVAASADQAGGLLVQVQRPTVSVRPATHGAVVREISLTQAVSAGDLDATTTAGAAELARRVRGAAEAACAKLDDLYPGSWPAGRSCVVDAARDAMLKVRAKAAAAKASGA
jgi:UrcA family protein